MPALDEANWRDKIVNAEPKKWDIGKPVFYSSRIYGKSRTISFGAPTAKKCQLIKSYIKNKMSDSTKFANLHYKEKKNEYSKKTDALF